MNFDSFEFLLCFLPITLFLYWFSIKYKKENIAVISLILCSLFFYAYFELKFLFLIIISILFNYYLSNLYKFTKDYQFDWLILDRLTKENWIDFSILGVSTRDGSLIKKVLTFSTLFYTLLRFF